MDVGAVPPPWPFSVSMSLSLSSVPQRQSGDVWWAERPPLAEEEPDFTDEDFNTVCVTSPPLKVPAGGDVEKKSPLTTDKPSPAESDKDIPVLTPITLLITEDDDESLEQEKLKEEVVSQTDLNRTDEDKVMITDHIISSELGVEREEEEQTHPDRITARDDGYVCVCVSE